MVLRHSFIKKGNLLAFGTNNGNIYLSFDKGKIWKKVTDTLSSISCLALEN
jgi:hypothetical protein